MITLRLNNDVTMPALGFGVFQTPPEETAASVEAALGVGYRLIDTAASYGNEREVGDGIRRSGHRARGGVPRDEGLDQRLRLRRHTAGLRQERRQAWRRPARPADPASSAAEPFRPHPRRLPGARATARRRQGARYRREQLHARAPRSVTRRDVGRSGCQPNRAPSILSADRAAAGAGRERHLDPGVITDRRHHLLPGRREEHIRRPDAA